MYTPRYLLSPQEIVAVDTQDPEILATLARDVPRQDIGIGVRGLIRSLLPSLRIWSAVFGNLRLSGCLQAVCVWCSDSTVILQLYDDGSTIICRMSASRKRPYFVHHAFIFVWVEVRSSSTTIFPACQHCVVDGTFARLWHEPQSFHGTSQV